MPSPQQLQPTENPFFFRLSRDNQTLLILGSQHDLPLAVLPQPCLDLLLSADSLYTELDYPSTVSTYPELVDSGLIASDRTNQTWFDALDQTQQATFVSLFDRIKGEFPEDFDFRMLTVDAAQQSVAYANEAPGMDRRILARFKAQDKACYALDDEGIERDGTAWQRKTINTLQATLDAVEAETSFAHYYAGVLTEYQIEDNSTQVTTRNQYWVNKLEASVPENHTAAVVVGNDHLGGHFGLLSALRRKAYHIERLGPDAQPIKSSYDIAEQDQLIQQRIHARHTFYRSKDLNGQIEAAQKLVLASNSENHGFLYLFYDTLLEVQDTLSDVSAIPTMTDENWLALEAKMEVNIEYIHKTLALDPLINRCRNIEYACLASDYCDEGALNPLKEQVATILATQLMNPDWFLVAQAHELEALADMLTSIENEVTGLVGFHPDVQTEVVIDQPSSQAEQQFSGMQSEDISQLTAALGYYILTREPQPSYKSKALVFNFGYDRNYKISVANALLEAIEGNSSRLQSLCATPIEKKQLIQCARNGALGDCLRENLKAVTSFKIQGTVRDFIEATLCEAINFFPESVTTIRAKL